MTVNVNLWAVLLSGVSSMVVGTLYYSDQLFGKEWKSLGKVDLKRFEKEMPKVMPLVFVAALIASYAVAYFSFLYHEFYSVSWLGAGVFTSLILWLGISTTSLFVHGMLDQRPRKLIAISVGNRLLSLLAMGLIIGWLHP